MKLVLLGNFAAACALAGLIWTVQVVVYPQFARVGAAEWAAYHAAHSARITWVVGPLMVAEAGLALLLFAAAPAERRALALVALALVGLAWAWTALVSVPLHGRLGHFDPDAVAALVRTNWVRTAAWTARAGLLGWWLVRG